MNMMHSLSLLSLKTSSLNTKKIHFVFVVVLLLRSSSSSTSTTTMRSLGILEADDAPEEEAFVCAMNTIRKRQRSFPKHITGSKTK